MENDLIKFWNDRFVLNDEVKEELKSMDPEKDYVYLAPSFSLVNACKKLAKYNNILDYGSGYDWASIIMSRFNAKKITSVDTSSNSKELAEYYASYFNAKNINHLVIDTSFLDNEESDKYDGVFISNVLDVVPEEVRKNIIKNIYRITKKNSLIIVGLNYYVPLEKIKPIDEHKNYLYIDNILRLVSLTDEEWISEFKNYFKVVKLNHFSWPGEDEKKRRLFYLIKE